MVFIKFLIILGFIFLVIPLIFFGAPFLPSLMKSKDLNDLQEVFNFLKKSGYKNNKFIDLGSGDGKVVIEFAKNGYESYGIEINPILALISWLKIKLKKEKRARIIWGNMWKINLSDFDVIFLFQYQLANNLLEKKIIKEAKRGGFNNKFRLSI